MDSLGNNEDLSSLTMDHGDVIPPLDEAIDIFAQYSMVNDDQSILETNEDSPGHNGRPIDCVIDKGNDLMIPDRNLETCGEKERDLHDTNSNLVNTQASRQPSPWRMYKPGIPVIEEDITKQDVQNDTKNDKVIAAVIKSKPVAETKQEDDILLKSDDICEHKTSSVTNSKGEEFAKTVSKGHMILQRRRHSVENISTKDVQTSKQVASNGKREENNNQKDISTLISNNGDSNQTKTTLPPKMTGRGHRSRRYSLADVSNMGLSGIEDKSFAREIRQHQIFLQNKNIKDHIIESSIRESQDDGESSSSGDLTSPRERARYLQRRRASHGTIAPILPNLHLPRSPRSSVIETHLADDDDLSEAENRERFNAYRGNKRRSSWSCTGAHSNTKPISTIDLLRQSPLHDKSCGTPASRDPYHMTVHFITDPGKAEGLRSFLRPLTSSIAPQLAIFNYAERSVNVRQVEHEDDDQTTIPALAIVVFIQEELGEERLESTQGFLKKEPWVLHHRSELGPTSVPYPTNNQDYYAHANSMPLWAVRQVHCGSDTLRCQIFVSDQHWSSSIQLYSTIVGHGVQYQKEDFCYFNIYWHTSRNLEIQLSLKRLPIGYTPLPIEDVILQFKISDMGSLVPLLPNVCSPISEKRWQTTDFDGNKILLLRGSDKTGRSPRPETPFTGLRPETPFTGLIDKRVEGSEAGSEQSQHERRSRSRQRSGRRPKHDVQHLTTIV